MTVLVGSASADLYQSLSVGSYSCGPGSGAFRKALLLLPTVSSSSPGCFSMNSSSIACTSGDLSSICLEFICTTNCSTFSTCAPMDAFSASFISSTLVLAAFPIFSSISCFALDRLDPIITMFGMINIIANTSKRRLRSDLNLTNCLIFDHVFFILFSLRNLQMYSILLALSD
ncbi:hypothetical protein D3C77_517420 [compost metagenome]